MNKDIVDTARKYVGLPWKHQGRTKSGLDCVGLIILIAHDLKISDFDYLNYKKDPDPSIMRQHLNSKMERILDITKREPGDVLYMSFYKHPQHLAIYTENNTIIHAARTFRGVVEHTLDTYWIQRIKEVYRYRR